MSSECYYYGFGRSVDSDGEIIGFGRCCFLSRVDKATGDRMTSENHSDRDGRQIDPFERTREVQTIV